jgi:hypothetical protein
MVRLAASTGPLDAPVAWWATLRQRRRVPASVARDGVASAWGALGLFTTVRLLVDTGVQNLTFLSAVTASAPVTA